MCWNQIKKWIVDNVADDYTPCQISMKEAVDLLEYIITVPIMEKDLAGIPELYSSALNNILVENKDKGLSFNNIYNVERFLRKLLYIVSPVDYNKQNEGLGGLVQLFKVLGLSTNHNIFNPSNDDILGHHIKVVYELRNKDSHYCMDLKDVKILNLLQSLFAVCLFAIDINSNAIKQWVISKNTNYQNYLNIVLNDFQTWNRRFVPINGKEQFQEVAIYAVETDWNKERNQQMREGEVEELREELINDGQNQMIIVGEAGIGKTTTMQYLAYRDALGSRLPIYVELKLLTTTDHLENVIRNKVSEITDDFESLMQSTDTCVFLDGLNEIMPIIKDSVYREIRVLIKKYPEVFFLISSRPQDNQGVIEKIPVFSLQKMDIAKIREFLRKNTNDDRVSNSIIRAVDENNEWLRILGTPLILYMLIRVVAQKGAIPDDENKIVIQFIKGLYVREKFKDFEFDEEYFHAIICRIAYDCINNVGNTNSGFTFAAIKKYLAEDIDIGDKELRSILQKSVELNLMVQDGNLFSFSHQLYQDTLAGDYFNTLYAD